MRIDTHQHFWLFDAKRDAWITDEMKAIQRDFLPNDISYTLKQNNFDGVVAVQASQSHQETDFLVELSKVYAMIKGVVGWVDLRSEKVESYLEAFSKYEVIKGFRHVIEGEDDADFLMRPDFLKGIKALTAYNYTYDLLIRPRHYASTLACVEVNPNQKFVLDHMAKPSIRTQEFDEWASFIEKLAAYPNVHCKVSGLATEADWQHWKAGDFTRYIKHVASHFGVSRLMYGSDWPVCLLAGSYEDFVNRIQHDVGAFSEDEAKAFWGGNAVKFYNLK